MNNTATVTGLNRFYGKVYGFLGMGLGISAVTAFLTLQVFTAQIAQFINRFPLGLTGLWLVELILVMVLATKGQKNPSLALGGFVVYSALNGLMLAITLSVYSIGSVTAAFVSASATFFAMGLFGALTKKDLSGIGRACYSALIGIIIAMLLNAFVLHSSPVEYAISFLMIFIMSGITAYDHQRIRTYYYQAAGQPGVGLAIFMALSLYLDFINLFLSFVRIFGKSN